MTFLETPRFPDDLSYGSGGGPSYKTTVVETFSGTEKRNIDWEYPRHVYDASYLARDKSKFYQLLEFFHVAQGRGNGFRYKDWLDYRSGSVDQQITDGDQQIGIGDGVTMTYQLVKAYVVGSFAKVRTITKPVAGTVIISVDDVPITSSWSVDTATGIVSFTVAPPVDSIIKAGFEFDVPVRFESDDLSAGIDSFKFRDVDVKLIELK